MKYFSRALFCGLFLLPFAAHAGVSVLGGAGLDTLKQTSPDAGKGDELKGLSIGALARFDIVSLGVAGIYGGAGLRYLSLSRDVSSVKVTVTGTAAEAELGGRFSVIPALLGIEGGVVYDYGLSGKSKVEAGGISVETDLDSMSRLGLAARALVSLAPLVSAGLELGYNTADIKVKGSSASQANGYNVRGVVSIGF